MESKKRSGKKRASENDHVEITDVEEIISSALKRRKSSKHNIDAHNSSKNSSTKSFRNSDAKKHDSVTALRDIPFDDVGSSTSYESRTSGYAKCLARNVRKTYASSCGRRQARKERNRLRHDDDFKSHSNATKDGALGKWANQKGVSGNDLKSLESIHLEKEGACSANLDCENVENPYGTAYSGEGNQNKGSEPQYNSQDGKKGSESTNKSNSSTKINQEAGSHCTQQMRLNPSSDASIVFSTLPSQSHIMSSPVVCSVTPVLCPSSTPGVPMVPLQGLAANTSAISTVTAPVMALPILPDGTQNISGNLGYTGEAQNTHMHSILKPAMNVSYQTPHAATSENVEFSTSDTSENMELSTTGSQNSSHVAVSGGDADELLSSDSNDMESIEVKDEEIPLIDIEDDCETLLIEKTEDKHIPDIMGSPSSHYDEQHSPESSTDKGRSKIVATVKLENWSSYLLQRLETFFDREEQCDVVLKFSGGQVVKAHRPIISACTSLLSKQPDEPESEVIVPPELDYASVEPILRFVYSGRLDVSGSDTKLSAIYIASQRLEVSLLTQLMNRRFPHLRCNRLHSSKHQVTRKSERMSKYSGQKRGKRKSKSLHVVSSNSSNMQSWARNSPSSDHSGEGSDANILKEVGIVEEERSSGCDKEEEDSSMYFLVTNSQKIAQANAAVRRKRPAETARPTRFELEDELESSAVQIAPWSSKSSLPPYFSSASNDSHENSISIPKMNTRPPAEPRSPPV